MGLGAVEVIFPLWHAFRGGGLSRSQFQREIALIRRTLREWLERGCACADSKTASFCENVLALEPALWTFTRKEGVEPTNNHMERLLRPGVLWRKNAFGCHSEAGCRFVERMLTVVQTLHLQKRPVLNFLYQSLLAHRHARKAPPLLAEG
jgi:transposase